ncbi:hypothetical protein I4U23_005709 [Adineta vaga]|nr:hypothetical protein I4U23_005709 [Adineta vaga]
MLLKLTFPSSGIILVGTNSLYVLETIFDNEKDLANEFQCIAAVNLVIWSFIFIVSIKGKGGTCALCASFT